MSIFTDIISKYSKIKFDGYTFISKKINLIPIDIDIDGSNNFYI